MAWPDAWGAVTEGAVGSSLKILRRALDSGRHWGFKRKLPKSQQGRCRQLGYGGVGAEAKATYWNSFPSLGENTQPSSDTP